MIDSATRQAIRVATDGIVGSYIMVPVDQLDRVRRLLEIHRVPHWVEHLAVSVNARPAITVINLGRKTDPGEVQALLDDAA